MQPMEVDNILLEKQILALLEAAIDKTTEQIVEEFRIEYSATWEKLKKEGEMLYGSSCTAIQQPATRISQILIALPLEMRLKKRNNGINFWSKPEIDTP